MRERRGGGGFVDGRGNAEMQRRSARQTPRKWMQRTLALMVLLTAVVVVDAAVPVSASSACANKSADWNAWTTVGCDVNCGASETQAVCKFVDLMDQSNPEREQFLASCARRNESDGGACQDRVECLVECMPSAASETNRDEWTLRLARLEETESVVQIGELLVPSSITRLTFDGSKSSRATKVSFRAGYERATSLRSMVFIGLDLSSSPSFPAIPNTLTELRIEDCMLTELPMAQILQLKHLDTLTIRRNIISQDASTIASLSAAQFEFLQTHSREQTAAGSVSIRGATPLMSCPDGHQSQWFNGVVVCVGGNAAELERRLQTSSSTRNTTAASSNSTRSSNSTSSSSDDDDDDDDSFLSQSVYVLVSLGAPALYFLYKVGLYLYFYATYSRHQRNVQVVIPQTTKGVSEEDNEERRTTENESSRSVEPPVSIVLPPPPADQRRFNNMSFWVDEELQGWRMDFNQVKMIKCITTTSNQKRHVRNSSAAKAISGCEIWLGTLSPHGTLGLEQTVVMKFIPPRRKEPQNAIVDKFKGEIKRQAQFSHPNVVKFFGIVWSVDTHLVAVTEYMARGDLRQWLHRSTQTDGGTWPMYKVQILLDVASALLYLHSMRPQLIHGNCNTRNVLLSENMKAKLSDFGSSKDMLSERELMAYSAVGSGRWISPEALVGRDTSAGSTRNDAADVYSFGILMSEVDTHELPFSDLMATNRSALPETDILQLIARGALTPTLSPTCHPGVGELIERCTAYNPRDRPSCSSVVQMLQEIVDDIKSIAGAMPYESDSDGDNIAVHMSNRSGVVV